MNKWVDKARGNDAIQGTASRQPAYSVAGLGAVFDGVNDSFALPVDINAGVLPQVTVIAVFKNRAGNAAAFAGVWGQDDGGWDRFLVSGGSGGVGISNGAGFTAVTGLTAENTILVSAATLIAGGTSTVHVNGVPGATFTEAATQGTTSLSIGDLDGPPASTANYGAFDGTISEVMIFDRALTASERNTLGAILAAKYGLAQYCGDAAKTGTEACDDGVNDGSYGTCNGDCTLAPRCGDGVVTGAEQCDLGAGNDGTGCDPDCTTSPAANILLHCSAVNTILHSFVGVGCHTVTDTGGASYIDILNANTKATLYPTSDCSGNVFLDSVTDDLNFCNGNFNDATGLNDRVLSVKLTK
jgi:hypothetical protein